MGRRKRSYNREKKAKSLELLDHDCLNMIPREAWAEHGETIEEVDTGIPRPASVHREKAVDGYFRHMAENCCGGCDNDEFDVKSKSPEKKECAGAELLRILGLTSNSAMCRIAKIYIEERIDGVIYHYFDNIREPAVISAVLRFVAELRGKLQELKNDETEEEFDVSFNTKALLIERAKNDRQYNFRSCPTSLLCIIIFGRDKFLSLLRDAP